MKTKRIMLLSALAVFLSFLLPATTCAQTTKIVTLDYSEDDFNFEYNTEGELMIYKNHSYFSENEEDPALPYISSYILIGKDEVFDSLTIQTQEQTVMVNVTMAHSPSVQIMSGNSSPMVDTGVSTSFRSLQADYPSIVAEYTGTHVMNGYKMLSLNVSPFTYNAQTHTLKLFSSMTLYVHKHSVPSGYDVNYMELARMRDEVMRCVINPEDVYTLYPLPTASTGSSEIPTLANTTTKYLIITPDSLANAFELLARWKTCKGTKTEIVTTEHIYANDSTSDSQELKIKKFIRNFRTANNNELQYVMLGGYGSLIPSLNCYIYEPASKMYRNIKTDLFYSCLDGEEKGFAFNWNKNGNDKFGEPGDSIDMNPDISISRLPVETLAQVETMINRIIAYEKNPPIATWKNNMLMCGVQMGDSIMNPSDGQLKSENLYNQVINNYWDGTRFRFYDTYTDFEGGASYNLTGTTLQDQLSQGYMFVDVMAHGTEFSWYLENETGYNIEKASSLQNTQPTVIMTAACNTNYVGDNGSSALSASFMQNPNSGIVAYFGCSDKNLGNLNSPLLTLGWEYEESFYRNLFSGYSWGRVGNLLKEIKNEMGKSNYSDVWLLFSWHVSGDPEMPIYTTTPMDPSNLHFGLKYNGDLIATGFSNNDEIEYCIMDAETGGNLYYNTHGHDNPTSFEIDMSELPDDFLLCLNRRNYPTRIYEIVKGNGTIYVQDKEIDNDSYWFGNRFVIGSHVTNDKPVGPVVIESGKTEIKTSKGVVINGEFEVKRGAEFSIEIGQLPW